MITGERLEDYWILLNAFEAGLRSQAQALQKAAAGEKAEQAACSRDRRDRLLDQAEAIRFGIYYLERLYQQQLEALGIENAK